MRWDTRQRRGMMGRSCGVDTANAKTVWSGPRQDRAKP